MELDLEACYNVSFMTRSNSTYAVILHAYPRQNIIHSLQGKQSTIQPPEIPSILLLGTNFIPTSHELLPLLLDFSIDHS